jgi:zinc protease
VLKVMLDEFARLGREPVPAADLAKRVAFLNGSMQRSLETSGGYTTLLATLIQQGVPASTVSQIAAARSAVTPSQAQDVAARIADPARATVVVVGNAAKFIDQLRALRGEVTVIKAADFDPDSPTLGAK